MDYLLTALKTLGAVFVMTLIIPAMVWGGSGSFKRAMQALRTYWLIMGGAFLAIGGLALLVTLLEFIDSGPHP
jgi:hypothetical protein